MSFEKSMKVGIKHCTGLAVANALPIWWITEKNAFRQVKIEILKSETF
jgi:hypothetical protein